MMKKVEYIDQRKPMLKLVIRFAIIAALSFYSAFSTAVFAVGINHITFGDKSYRLTNFYEEDYNYLGGWIENRVAVEDLPVIGNKMWINPYLKIAVTLSSHTEIPEENLLVYGIGLENRVFEHLDFLHSSSWLDWLRYARLYAEYLRVRFLRREVGSWIPREDWRYGIELWKEFNVSLTAKNITPESFRDRAWAEVWFDISWKKSNFFMEDYKAWTGNVVSRLGVRYPKVAEENDIFLMPYLVNELSVTQWRFFWQNRALTGLGLRLMPFQHAESDWLRRLRIYIEYLWAVRYFEDRPTPWTPNHDFRVGINFSNAWWR
ncbi:MAG: hypothetical protein ACFFC6_13200 [Promethearchaeota archaeon]